jgi:hypothetical protein
MLTTTSILLTALDLLRYVAIVVQIRLGIISSSTT